MHGIGRPRDLAGSRLGLAPLQVIPVVSLSSQFLAETEPMTVNDFMRLQKAVSVFLDYSSEGIGGDGPATGLRIGSLSSPLPLNAGQCERHHGWQLQSTHLAGLDTRHRSRPPCFVFWRLADH